MAFQKNKKQREIWNHFLSETEKKQKNGRAGSPWSRGWGMSGVTACLAKRGLSRELLKQNKYVSY